MPNRCETSTILVSYNCLESLERSLASLKSQQGIEHEIIIVDNGSSDGSVEYLRGTGIKTIFSDRNLGYGQAINLGAEEASGKYLFVLNPDTEFSSSVLADLYRFAENSECLGMISPLILHPDGGIQVTSRKLPGRVDFFLGRGSPIYKLGIADESAAGYIRPKDDKPLEVPSVSATALFINRDLFDEIGGFDERFFLYLEDIDICKRISERDLKIVLLPSVSVIHSWRGSSRKRKYFAIYHHHLSVWKYFKKHFPNQYIYNFALLTALVFGFIISSLLAAIKLGSKE
ncbi:MAG: glycosyltransferase family 2 protein [candidate division Zixibacteria bacterium]